MQLLNGYILIRVDKEETKTTSGILLKEGSVKLPASGEVEDVADSVTSVKAGDRVQFLRYASIDGVDEDTRICTEDMIIARL
jgi:co-chaperonin GroES (HSP10)